MQQAKNGRTHTVWIGSKAHAQLSLGIRAEECHPRADGADVARAGCISRWTVRLVTTLCSCSNAPRIRSAPHHRFLAAISFTSLMQLIVSLEWDLRVACPRVGLPRPEPSDAFALPAETGLRCADQERLLPRIERACKQDEARDRRGCSGAV